MYRRQFNVLVLDDDTVALYQTIALLTSRDYIVFGAPNVELAGWFLSQYHVDLVVAAVRLRRASGLEFLAAARPHYPALAAILVGNPADRGVEMDAWGYDASVLIRPVDPAHFLMVVAEKLAAIRQRQRWPRKTVGFNMPVLVAGSPATLVDVSYGGLRFALHGESFELASPMTVECPAAGVQVQAHLVWSSRASDGVSCVCGAAIADDEPNGQWRRFVDWVPQAA